MWYKIIVIFFLSWANAYDLKAQDTLNYNDKLIKNYSVKLKNYKSNFLRIKTEESLKEFYIDLIGFIENVNNNLGTNDVPRDYDSLKSYLSPYHDFLVPVLIEEGTKSWIVIYNLGFYNKSLKTKGKDDDVYFKNLFSIYGVSGDYLNSFPVWITQRTDISGSIKLGDSTVFTIYKKLKEDYSKGGLFQKQNLILLEQLKNDILSYRKFDNKKNDVINELNSINNFDKTISLNIDELISNMNETSENYQFECNEGNCTFE